MTPMANQAWGATTHVGARRTLNEDSYLAQSPIFVVADGMGGHQQGEVASAIAVQEFATLTQYPTLFPEQVDSCFRRGAARLRAVLPDGVGGTTVCGVAIVLQDDAAYWLVFNWGDSRVYQLKPDGTLTQISVDHSVVQELIESGELSEQDAKTHEDRNVITRALETVTTPEPEYWMLPIEAGDQILLCSDGLTGEVPDQGIAQIWRAAATAQEGTDNLVQAALNAGGRDNITAVIVTSDVVPNWAGLTSESTHRDWDLEMTRPTLKGRNQNGVN